MRLASFRDVASDRILSKHHDMIVQDEGNNGRQAGKKHVADLSRSPFCWTKNAAKSGEFQWAARAKHQNESVRASRRRATGSHPRITSEGRLFGIMLFV